jgi:hypothetical protein
MITVKIEGLPALQRSFATMQQQIPFATARALTVTAHQVNAEIKAEMRARIAGGPTPYTLGAFAVTAATKSSPSAEISLRSAPPGGTPFETAIGHLFRGGKRDFKRLETVLRLRGLIPPGLQIAPARGLPVDARGNPRMAAIKEMLGVVTSPIRNLRIYARRTKKQTSIAFGFFCIFPGASRHLAPGIYRRVEIGSDSYLAPWLFFVAPPPYRQLFDLEKTATRIVAKNFSANFNASMAAAMASART